MAHVMVVSTGQKKCYDRAGREISCGGTGQDATVQSGIAWPSDRFQVEDGKVLDQLTGLIWTQDANPSGFPVTWQEALDRINEMNGEHVLDRNDWRLPNRRELHSLMSYQSKKPSLPQGHPFRNYFLGWYWTSTSAAINPSYAWYVHLEGARMFYGRKRENYLFWPVCGKGNGTLAATGQLGCFNQMGEDIECRQSFQDGELRIGRKWPQTRFIDKDGIVLDRLTNLSWLKKANITPEPVDWQTALDMVARLRKEKFLGMGGWRLPTINELESLTDCSQFGPALPARHPFEAVQETYWSSTTSFYETDWAWVYYMIKGALGVGYKPDVGSFVWPVFHGDG
ncbi:MAG: DUF1566 domain-containing protein [Desulfobulbaceae bacterium]|nr:DUF1566 domain-containing protein [Desulfobulbaceae bacterium]